MVGPFALPGVLARHPFSLLFISTFQILTPSPHHTHPANSGGMFLVAFKTYDPTARLRTTASTLPTKAHQKTKSGYVIQPQKHPPEFAQNITQ